MWALDTVLASERGRVSAGLTIGLLGPLEVRSGGVPVPVGAPKQRSLLAMLALEAGGVVSTDQLVDRLWEGRAPATAVATLQVYVSQLRKLLRNGAIATRRPGYVLVVDPSAVDAAAFERLAIEGRSLLSSGETGPARRVLAEGLSLWRGAALSEFIYEEWAAAPARHLEELRMVAREDLLDARLGLGASREVVGELEELVAEFPLRERLRGQLMLALYRSGRQADALAAFQDARRALVDELGIDPSANLVELERRILQQDPTLGSAGDTVVVGTMAAPTSGDPPEPAVGSPRRERKVVTVLFCDLVEFTAASDSSDPEDVDALLDLYYTLVRREIERFGGTVEKFIGDAVMAVFGAPVAREDDPERAVRAALAVVERANALRRDDPGVGLQVRIGITTGEVLARLDPAAARGEAMVSGDVVNTASRLQAAAPAGRVLVDTATHQGTSHVVRYEQSESVVAKGKPDAIPVWVAVELGATPGDGEEAMIPLIGRVYEFGTLVNAFARTRDDESAQLVSLVGVPGIGKSRLVAELRQYVDADPRETTWRQGRSLAYGEGVAFWALGEVVKAHAGIRETDSGPAAETKLRVCVTQMVDDADEVEWITTHLASLVGVESADGDVRPDRAEAFSAWRRFVEAMGDQRPTVLVFEDLHWADDALLDFIDLLADRVTTVPLLIVCTARPEFLQRRPGWGGGKPNASTLSLPPLGPAETEQLIAGFLAEDGLAGQRRSQVVAQSEGNPLFVREYVRMLRDTDEDTLIDSAEVSALPGTIHGLIAARLDALSEEDKRIAQVASVIGRVSWLGAMSALTDTPERELEEALHRLEQRQLLRRARRSAVPGETEFTFTHALIQDVAYNQIPRADRAAYHLAAADWIEGISGERDDRIELLGHHLLAAVRLRSQSGGLDAALGERACDALGKAGDRAISLSAYTAAANHYRAALELAADEDSSAAAHLLLGLGKTLFQTATTFPTELEVAAGLFERLGDLPRAAEAEAVWAAWLVNHNAPDEAYRHAEHACSLLEAEPDSPEKAFALGSLGRIGSERGDAGGWEHLVAFSEMADRIGSLELRVRAAFMVAEERLFRDDPAGIAEIDESLRLARGLKSSTAVLCKMCAVSDLLAQGRVTESRDIHTEALQAATDLWLASYGQVLQCQMASLTFVSGEWSTTRTVVDAAPRTMSSGAPELVSTHILGVDVVVAIRALISLADGRVADAIADARLAVELCGTSWEAGIALAFGSYTLASAGEASTAAEFAESWIGMVRESRGFGTSFAWPFVAQSFRIMRREEEFLGIVDLPRVRTPWLECARSIAAGEHVAAQGILRTIGADAIAGFIAADSPALQKPSTKVQ